MPDTRIRYGAGKGYIGSILFNGATGTTIGTGGIAGVFTKAAVGQYSVSLLASVGGTRYTAAVLTDLAGAMPYIAAKAAASLGVNVIDRVTGLAVDPTEVNVIFYGV